MCPVIRVFGHAVSAYFLLSGAACAVFWILFARALGKNGSAPRRMRILPVRANICGSFSAFQSF